MNPHLLLAAAGAWTASVVAVGIGAYGAGQDAEIAARSREDHAAAVATEAAASAAAAAIARIEVKNVTLRQPLETIVRTERVFVDCRSGDAAVRLLNATAAGAVDGPDHGELPASGAAR